MNKVAYTSQPMPAKNKLSHDIAVSATPSQNRQMNPQSNTKLIPSKTQSTTIYVNTSPYTVIRLLGEGLHSRVYAAYDSRTGQSVAIKVVRNLDSNNSKEHSKIFLKEIRYLMKLQPFNPYVIRVYNFEYDQKSQTGKMVMETGHDFRFMLPIQAPANKKRMTNAQAKFYWYQMVEAVALLHDNGIVHSDIKPENFIMTQGGQLRIIDLGLSFRLPVTQQSVLRPFAGTPEYMPPEVCQIQNGQYSRQGRASDIWALGVLLFEMTFGYRPFEHIHDNYEKMFHIARLKQNPIVPPIPNSRLRDAIQQCLQINPLNRPSAKQLLQHPFFKNG